LTDGCSNIHIHTWKCVWWVDNAHPSMNQILSIIEFHPMDHINNLIVQQWHVQNLYSWTHNGTHSS
jgi:hypothetical protein